MKIHVVFGTRPEAIKLAPVIKELRKLSTVEIKVCVTSQHRAMLEQALSLFKIIPDIDLNIMKPNQSLTTLTESALKALSDFFQKERSDLVLVQGDTSTSFVTSLAAFYHRISVGHVEAGIRSYNKYSPWPEEVNRKMITCIADLFFAPTSLTAQNLENEGVNKQAIHITGNTIVDVLVEVRKVIKRNPLANQLKHKFSYLDPSKKLLLVTAHRRESFGLAFEEICKALVEIVKASDVQLVFPVHLNPNVQIPVYKYLKNIKNIFLIEPQDYFSFIYLIERCYLVLTDSGGIQEEAPSFGKPLIVMREVTERLEGIKAGVAKLAGTAKQSILETTLLLLENETLYNQMVQIANPYGDGKASIRIREIISKQLSI